MTNDYVDNGIPSSIELLANRRTYLLYMYGKNFKLIVQIITQLLNVANTRFGVVKHRIN